MDDGCQLFPFDDNIMNSIDMLDEFVPHFIHEIDSYIYYIFF